MNVTRGQEGGEERSFWVPQVKWDKLRPRRDWVRPRPSNSKEEMQPEIYRRFWNYLIQRGEWNWDWILASNEGVNSGNPTRAGNTKEIRIKAHLRRPTGIQTVYLLFQHPKTMFHGRPPGSEIMHRECYSFIMYSVQLLILNDREIGE
jgi:hypothetical protein